MWRWGADLGLLLTGLGLLLAGLGFVLTCHGLLRGCAKPPITRKDVKDTLAEDSEKQDAWTAQALQKDADDEAAGPGKRTRNLADRYQMPVIVDASQRQSTKASMVLTNFWPEERYQLLCDLGRMRASFKDLESDWGKESVYRCRHAQTRQGREWKEWQIWKE